MTIMNKKLYSLLLALLTLTGLLSGCKSDDDIVFDYEQPQFEIRKDAILFEVTTPRGTSASDEIYISGPFNGGDAVAVGNPQWMLEKAFKNNIKFGFYVYPNQIQAGKSLADGFHFVSKKNGAEVDKEGTEIMHYDNPGVGTRTPIIIDGWKIVNNHDGYAIFIEDLTGYDKIAMYAWSSTGEAELFGGWPGKEPNGTEVINGVTYKFWDFGEENEGKTYNFIVNNNGGGAQFDLSSATVLTRDYYYTCSPGGIYEEVDPATYEGGAPKVPTPLYEDGAKIYVQKIKGYESAKLYVYGDADIFGGWPGGLPNGEEEINGITYYYWFTGAENAGKKINPIINNDNNGQQFDVANDVVLGSDNLYYGYSPKNNKGVTVNPATYNGRPDGYGIYVEKCLDYKEYALYIWGDAEIFGGWPGQQAIFDKENEDAEAKSREKTINGVTYVYWYTGAENEGKTANPIVNNNNNGEQKDLASNIVLDHDYYFGFPEGKVTEVDPETYEGAEPVDPNAPVYKDGYFICVLIDDDVEGYDEVALYAWQNEMPELFGGWPGTHPNSVTTTPHTAYFYTGEANKGLTYKFILNNNNNGTQVNLLDDTTLNGNKYFHVSKDGVNEISMAAARALRSAKR